jgi:acyl dehydratase
MDTAAAAWDFAAMSGPTNTMGHGQDGLFYEDMIPGRRLTSTEHLIDGHELVQFARTWDPLPFHIDEEAGRIAFGGVTAPGLYMLAVKQRLIHTLPFRRVIASLGYDEVRFHLPMRPGDIVHVLAEWLERRESASKGDRGVVTVRFSLINQRGDSVMSHLDKILVRRRLAASPSTP